MPAATAPELTSDHLVAAAMQIGGSTSRARRRPRASVSRGPGQDAAADLDDHPLHARQQRLPCARAASVSAKAAASARSVERAAVGAGAPLCSRAARVDRPATQLRAALRRWRRGDGVQRDAAGGEALRTSAASEAGSRRRRACWRRRSAAWQRAPGSYERELAVDDVVVVERVAAARAAERRAGAAAARARDVAQEARRRGRAPSCAPSIRPGMSAMTKRASSSTRTTPRFGTSVVNG